MPTELSPYSMLKACLTMHSSFYCENIFSLQPQLRSSSLLFSQNIDKQESELLIKLKTFKLQWVQSMAKPDYSLFFWEGGRTRGQCVKINI